MATAAVLSLAVALTVGLPRLLLRYSYSYGEYLRVRAKVTEDRVNGAVIFLGPPRAFYYGAAFLDNALDFQGSVVYAVDRGAENYLLMRRFPGRTYYRADPDTFFQISDPESLRNTPEMRDLDQAGRFISQIGMSGYRYVLLPYREAGTLIDTGTARCWTFREASYGLLRRQRESSDFLPAIAVFMPDDPRRYSPLFEPMREQESYDAGGCRFTFLFSADSGKAVVFDIHPGTNESGDTCP